MYTLIIAPQAIAGKPGDTFSCLSFTVGRPLYVLLGGDTERSYGMGLTHGISSIEIE